MTEIEHKEYKTLLARFPHFTPKDPTQETPERALRRLKLMRSIRDAEDSGLYDELGGGAWMSDNQDRKNEIQ